MILDLGEYQLGPSNARLRLRTYRRGFARSVGHDLVLVAGRWSGTVVAGASPADSLVSGWVDIDSLVIAEAAGGVMALSDRDRADLDAELRKQLGVKDYPRATFRSSAITATDDEASVEGLFTVRGAAAPLTLKVARTASGTFTVTAVVVQTAHGIKPFSAFLGALKQRDEVDVEIEIDLMTT